MQTRSPKRQGARTFTSLWAVVIGVFCCVASHAATFNVTSTNDNGAGSLRQAILDANAAPGPDLIQFNIASAGLTISPTNALPPITDPVTLDATTQPGYAGTPVVELNGLSAGAMVDGLRLWAGNSAIRGLVINRFNGDGIEIATNGNNIIEGCIIGLNVAGTSDQGNNLSGIFITNAPNNRIGGTSTAQRNVISGNNQNGVLIQALAASGNIVLGNFIGLNATGGVAVANSANGVFITGAPSNTVGGTLPGSRNVISGNSQSGVRIEGTNAFRNLIAGNFVGLDAGGSVDLGNAQQGVLLFNAPTNTLGGVSTTARNIISGNNQTGVRLDGVSAQGNRIIGNFIGTDASGQLSRGNTFEGVNAQNSASFNSIGGTSGGEANLIAFNGGDGVFLPNGTNNSIRANAIHSNAGLGIDLGSDGKQANDAGDADIGANQLQNYPLLTAATNTPGGLVVFGSLNSRPNTAYTLDFYSNPIRDPSTNGEGRYYVGSLAISTAADSNALFNVAFAVGASGRFISATATDTNGNTSEFSPCVRAESTAPPTSFTVINTNDSGPGSLRQAILANNEAVTTGRNIITFAIPGSGPHLISALSQLPSPTEPVLLDGFTQSGTSPNSLSNGNNAVLKVRLDGASAGSGVDGLRLTSTGMVVRGMAITRFSGDGIEISTNGQNAVEGCFIGLDTDGTNALGNGAHGIHVNATANNKIGGAAPAQRNLISANGQNGVHITGGEATNNFIAGNFIGTDRSGTVDLGNNSDGVNLNNAPFNLVGSLASGTGNLISGNNNDGIDLNGASTTNNTVLGNIIGTDVTGALGLGNGQNGVAFNSNARFNRVGVNVGGGANVIAFNGNIGVSAGSGTNNAIQANRIFSNGALGIDLANNGVTTNDTGDADSGPNQLQNFPVITSGTINPASVVVAGTLNSRPNSSYVLDFFANLACDASGNGEGQQPFGSAAVTTDGSGNATFNVTLPGVPVGRYLTATATDASDNSSEFSACFAATSTLPPVTLTVVNTNDSGPGSLRQALLDAGNFASATANIIAFAIPGAGPHTIAPLTQLPTPAEPVFIDGYTQPGSSPNTLSNGNNAVIKIRLDGASNGSFGADGLRLRAGRSTVRGLALLRWTASDAIEITQGDGNRVAGCFLGIDLDGSDKHNGQSIFITSAGNEIGGLTPADRNVISYSFGDAIRISGGLASNNVVRGNFLGTDLTGTLPRPNFIAGVTILDATNNAVGGTEPGARNIISGNQTGLTISGNSGGNVVLGNFIGTDVSGTADVGNASGGVSVTGGSGHVIGGASAAARNIISGNDNAGVGVFNASSVSVIGNWIGLSATGAALSNSAAGVHVSGNSNRIGGVLAGEGNIISGNADSGVIIAGGIGNAIRGNSIYENRVRFAFRPGLGIDLGEDGVTANDVGDGDTGPNDRQNFPLVASAFSSGASTTVQGSLNSAASQTYQLDFFANLVCDASGNGEGQQYLGSASVNTDGSGNGVFNATLPVSALGRFITATATDAQGSTSEFSPCYEATLSTPPMTYTVTTTNDSGPGSLRQAILNSNGHISSQNNTIAFNIPGSGVRAIKLLSPLPAFIQPVTIDGFTQPGAGANTLAGGNSVDANWLIELRGVGASFGEKTLRLNLAGLIVRGLRLTASAGLGVELVSSNCVVAGCLLSANTAGGITINAGSGNRIGGPLPADRNVISGQGGSLGVEINNGNNNLVLGNLLGPAPDGTSALGNQFGGVSIFNGSGNVIGDGTAGGANVVAFSSADAVSIQSGTNNSVRGNRIFSNNLGIDLSPGGVTANDSADSDDGANHLQNFPILTNVVANVGSTLIQGQLNSRPNTAYTLDFYANTACHFSGNGEGEFYLGSANVVTDGGGNADFNVALPLTTPRAVLTATATDPAGNTSEFSPCRAATINLPGQTFTVINTNDSGPGSLRQAILNSALVPNTGADRIHFNIPGAGPHRINLLSSLPPPMEPLIIDGYTQPGASPNTSSNADNAVLKVQLDGSFMGGGSALAIANSGNTIRGLSFTRFTSDAVVISGPSNLFEGNWVGVAPGGAAGSNANGGVTILSSFNVIGGTNPAARNVISANEDGILIAGASASNNVIAGNFIGVGASGTNALGNSEDGVRILGGASWNSVGDLTNSAAGNTIAYNGEDGVSIDSGRQNEVGANRIWGNGVKNIFVAPGANDGVQAPQVTQAYTGSLVVKGKFDGAIDTSYIVSVYIEEVTYPNFKVLSSRFIGITGATTDGFGKGEFNATFEEFGSPSAAGGVFDRTKTTLTCEHNTSEEGVPVIVLPGATADLKITMAPPTSPVNIGDTITYVMTVTNCGPATASNVCVQVEQSPGLQVLSAASPNGNCTVENGVVKCKVPSLAAGQTTQVTVTAKANGPGQMLTRASVSSDRVDPFELNNGVLHDVFVRAGTNPSELGVALAIDRSSVRPGNQVSLTARHRNNGLNTANNVKLTHSLPPGTVLQSHNTTKGNCILTDGILTCDVDSLAIGEEVTVNLGVRVNTLGPQAAFEFGSTIWSAQGDPLLVNNVSSAAVALDLPQLQAAREGGQTKFFWEGPTTGLQLERTTDLSGLPEWLTVPANQITFENGNHVYRPTDEERQAFVRLTAADLLTPSVEFYQQGVRVDVADVMFSELLRADVTFRKGESVNYLNVSVPCPEPAAPAPAGLKAAGQQNETNVCWVVENVPLITNATTNRATKVSVNFPLSSNSIPLHRLNYGFSITTNRLTVPPPVTNSGPVFPSVLTLRSGISNSFTTWRPALPLAAGPISGLFTAKPNFWSTEQGVNECTPAAVMDSLTYLKRNFPLRNLPSGEITLGKMKEATGWTPAGAAAGFLDFGTWADLKDTYMQDRDFPIITTQTTDMTRVITALTNCCDVEIWIEGHVAAVVAIADIGSGDYALTLSHDIRQGAIGGLVREIVIFDSEAGEIYGSAWGRDFVEFVIECPAP